MSLLNSHHMFRATNYPHMNGKGADMFEPQLCSIDWTRQIPTGRRTVPEKKELELHIPAAKAHVPRAWMWRPIGLDLLA
jgi:hypothetical protein